MNIDRVDEAGHRHARAVPPRVSCIIIFLDGVEYLDEAIGSVVGQVDPPAWELILVDDGSTDGSSEIGKAWAMAHPERIRYADHPGHVNLGMSASRNHGVRLAEGEYIAFLDADDVWLPSMLANRVRLLDENPSAGAVVGATWEWYGWTGTENDRRRDRVRRLPDLPLHTAVRPPTLFHELYGRIEDERVPQLGSVLVRRRTLLDVGVFNVDFRTMYEDQVVFTKLFLHTGVVLDDRPLSLYRQHPRSVVSVAFRSGPLAPDHPLRSRVRFLEWLATHVDRQPSIDPSIRDLVTRHLEEARLALRRPPRPSVRGRLRSLGRRLAPDFVLRAVRHRRQVAPAGHLCSICKTPAHLEYHWVQQFVHQHGSALAGDGLIVGDVPSTPELAGTPCETLEELLDEARGQAEHDWIVVRVDLNLTSRVNATVRAVAARLRPNGLVLLVVPGGACSPERRAGDSCPMTRSELRTLGETWFDPAGVVTEVFGSVQVLQWWRSVESAHPLAGIEVDRHDPRIEMLLALAARRGPNAEAVCSNLSHVPEAVTPID